MRLNKPRGEKPGYSFKAEQDTIGKPGAHLGPLAWAVNTMALISRWANYLGMGFITVLMFVMTVDVLLRWIFNRPIRGVNELAEFSMLLLIFLTIGYTQNMKSNISVDILTNKFSPRTQAGVFLMINLLNLGISILLLKQSIVYNSYLAGINQKSAILKLPVAPFQFVTIIGFSMVTIVLILQLIDSVNSLWKTVKQ